MAGTLFEVPDQRGLQLIIDGHFSEPANPTIDRATPEFGPPLDDVALLLGTTAEGKSLSLIGCRTIRSGGLRGLTKSFQVFRPSVVAYDVHFANLDEFRLTSLSGHFSNLDQWADTSGVSYSLPSGGIYPMTITYAKPESIKAELSNGFTVDVDFSATFPDISDRSGIQIKQKAWLGVRSSTERSYDELLSTLSMVADFVCLGIGQAMRLAELEASAFESEKAELTQKQVYFPIRLNSEPIAPIREDVPPHRMLFTLTDIRENFAQLLEGWFGQQDKIGPLYSLYFGTMRNAGMYVEQRFLNMFQALESYDRRDFQPSDAAMEKLKAKKTRILHAVQQKKDRDWLKGKLRYCHEDSAGQRISRLVGKYNADWIFEDTSNEIELAVDFRNFYTHYDRTVEAKLPNREERPRALHNLAARLQVLCEIILLRETGFQESRVRSRLQETQRLTRKLARH